MDHVYKSNKTNKSTKDKIFKKKYSLIEEIEPNGKVKVSYKLFSEIKKNGNILLVL